jgi:hypothetical protein
MGKCHECKEKQGNFYWGKYLLCQTCETRVYTICEGRRLLERFPELEKYIEADQVLNGFSRNWSNSCFERAAKETHKKLEDFGIGIES